MSMQRHVHDGALWLDDRRPGWADGIEITKLDMRDQEWCVLGQLYGDYFMAKEWFMINGCQLGFDMWFGTKGRTEKLHRLWGIEIAMRRTVAAKERAKPKVLSHA